MVERAERMAVEMKLELQEAARREAEMKHLASRSDAERLEEGALRVAAERREAEVRRELEELKTKLAKVSMLLASDTSYDSASHNPQLEGR